MKKILFQGDSITDCNRARDNDIQVGLGYARLIKSYLGFECPNEYEFINKGASGDRIVDMYARVKRDIINLSPDYISILIGVNDVWHELDAQNGVDADKYEKIYSMTIEEIQEALPNVKIMIMEPFCLKGSATENSQEPARWITFSTEVKKRAERARKVAEKYGLTFVELQKVFEEAAAAKGNTCLMIDGVHPTEMGHELLKREWLNAFGKMISA